ncbi:MAG: phenylalanine--tRNA ligase subunit alpha [Pirellulaceae bacterium]|nr:phenylalanine--tRNA ligase subunit alpha [Planctomycetales bacterium]
MSLSEFVGQLDALLEAAIEAFNLAHTEDALEEARISFLGAKSGRLKTVQKQMGSVAADDRKAAGQRLNEVKQLVQDAFEAACARVQSQSGGTAQPAIDHSLPGIAAPRGHLHPLTQTINELKEIMGRLGFEVAEGPEVEDERHNFDALNIPAEHPARDPLDNFYVNVGPAVPMLLRSQTSTVQIRVMESRPWPIRIISLGRVYRPDTADATHYPMFHQMEGLLIDRHVTMADLKSVLRMFASSYLGADVHVRFRPSFFPFTEPSVEADFWWNGNWVEFGGAGMVDPNVLSAVGYDPEEVSGFAFGLGIERLCMRRHNVTDIREFYRNDVRFLQQF